VASGTSCASATCNGSNQFVAGSTCNGSGSCVAPTGTSCGAYVCKTSGCPTTCSTSTDCVSGDYCDGGSHQCLPQLAPGAACITPDQCPSGFCTNGFCCGSSSCPSCYTCAGTGTCGVVGVGLPDPTNTCTTSCASDNSTLTENLCDGLGSCMVTSCATSTCSVGPPPVCQ
jgi:hypothetical protein